ncbi:MAG: hypothetical protein CMP36_00735 [Rickettsiales bacterium]|nr:hypothetical protein [Rickettsiales bacterium]OUV83104.1 MAG: hypothetical protein CBC91_01115 [Rickettsiales bacterium TMED131]
MQYIINSKIINLIIVITTLLLINSCAYFRIKTLDKHDYSENNIYDLIAKEYKNFANYELYEMHDEIDANYFAFKAINTLNKKIIKIEEPHDWNIPNKYIKEVTEEYNKINSLLKKDMIFNYPILIAKVVSGYDCWLEQLEENWQIKDIANCKLKFISAYNELLKIEKNNNKKNIALIEKDKLVLNKERELKNIYNLKKEIVLYFDHDSYKLNEKELSKIKKSLKGIKSNQSIIIYGHTDTKGSKNYNLKLSKKRATAVMNYLQSISIENNIITIGYGERYPLIVTGDETTEEKNRRAEIIINY